METARLFIGKLVAPKSLDEDHARKEFILNILLLAAVGLLTIAVIINGIKLLSVSEVLYRNDSLSLVSVIIVLAFFCFLYFLSRKGLARISAYIFLAVFFILASYMKYKWGVDVNAGLLLDVLVIVMAGILINTRFAFLATAIVAVTIFVIDYLQNINILDVNQYWRSQDWTLTDSIMTIIIFLIIATVCWLSNREIYKALKRAKISEIELKKERDFLEIKVEERTQELKKTQMEKVGQLYRFAEFGRLSSGMFHDLTNLLTAVSINMEMAHHHEVKELDQTKSYLERALSANDRMKNFIEAIRRQISGQDGNTVFSLNHETENVIQVLSYRGRKQNVILDFISDKEVFTFGSAVKFNQIATNLIANAIDAYVGSQSDEGFKVKISLNEENGLIIFSVEDWGCGIPSEVLNKIFEPFFTTKSSDTGTGIGLSLTKRMVEKDFGGTITVQDENKHTKFLIKFLKKGG